MLGLSSSSPPLTDTRAHMAVSSISMSSHRHIPTAIHLHLVHPTDPIDWASFYVVDNRLIQYDTHHVACILVFPTAYIGDTLPKQIPTAKYYSSAHHSSITVKPFDKQFSSTSPNPFLHPSAQQRTPRPPTPPTCASRTPPTPRPTRPPRTKPSTSASKLDATPAL